MEKLLVGSKLACSLRTHVCTSTSKTSAGTKARRSPSRAGCTTAARAARSISSSCATARGFIQAVMSKAAVGDELFKAADHLSQETSVIVTGTARADKRAPSGYEIDVKSLEVVGDVARLPDHAEGARRRLPARPPAPLDPQRAAAGDPARSATRSSTRSATSSTAAASSSPTRRSSRRRRARARRRCSRRSTSRTRRRT